MPKDMKRCSTSLVIREMQKKTTRNITVNQLYLVKHTHTRTRNDLKITKFHLIQQIEKE